MKVLAGTCPDSECSKQLFFPESRTTSVECSSCGQRHELKHFLNVHPVSDPGHALRGLLQSVMDGQIPTHVKKTSDFIKVKGLSNYGCKLISPLLTKYGLKKNTQEVCLLKDMNQGETFDCSHLADRAFLIEEKNLLISGYGKDVAVEYLQGTLQEIAKVNNGEERLIPIHADGDGHCLLHAISRALVGHELFWHPLLTNLKLHFINRQEDYQNLFIDFIEASEWKDIIAECDPDFVPSYGETHGLRNIHVLGLANVLHRPIILIDSLEGMQSKGDYSGLFLPGLVPLEKCRNKGGKLHKPIVISWSSKGHNHFIPLVGVQKKELPQFPLTLLPKVWGLSQDLLSEYIEIENNSCVIGGGNSLQERYLIKLTQAMEKQFFLLEGVSTSVVSDVYHHIFRPGGIVGVSTRIVTDTALAMVRDERLYKCLFCHSVAEPKLSCSPAWLEPGGDLYELALKTHGVLKDKVKYKFPVHDLICQFDKKKNKLKCINSSESSKCSHCKGAIRKVKADGTLGYFNGDQLSKVAQNSTCGCGYKHYWDGKEYDNLPIQIPIKLEWEDEEIDDVVSWFQHESDPSLNSNAFALAQQKVQEHFPGSFGSERLVQNIADRIFQFTSSYYKDESKEKDDSAFERPKCIPTKIILTGEKSKTLHKEELNVSECEKKIQRKIEQGASVKQKRTSSSNVETKDDQIKTSPPSSKQSKDISDSPTKDISDSPTKEKVKRAEVSSMEIRIACEDKGNTTFTFNKTTSYNDLEKFVRNYFQIADDDKITMKCGFPPKILDQNINNRDEPLTLLKHKDRLNVHIVKAAKSEQQEPVQDEEQLANPAINQLASSLFSLFDTGDPWDWACRQRSIFQVNGLIYKMAFRDLGLLSDDQHLSLPCFPNKIFVYNQKEDEILLCLGKLHVPVKPLTHEEIELANEQGHQKAHELTKPHEPIPMHVKTEEKSLTEKTYSLQKPANYEEMKTVRQTIDFATFKLENNTVELKENKDSEKNSMEVDVDN